MNGTRPKRIPLHHRYDKWEIHSSFYLIPFCSVYGLCTCLQSECVTHNISVTECHMSSDPISRTKRRGKRTKKAKRGIIVILMHLMMMRMTLTAEKGKGAKRTKRERRTKGKVQRN